MLKSLDYYIAGLLCFSTFGGNDYNLDCFVPVRIDVLYGDFYLE